MHFTAPDNLDLYDRRLRDLAAHAPLITRLNDPDTSAMAHSRPCGSRITIDLRLCDGTIAAYGHVVRACLIGQASASLFAQAALGCRIGDVAEGAQIVQMFLKSRTTPAPGRWQGFSLLAPVADYPTRHAAALPPFDAALQAMTHFSSREPSEMPVINARLQP